MDKAMFAGYDIEGLIKKANELQAESDRRLELLKEGLEATTLADGHWSDRVRWMNWVEKVKEELADAKK